MNQSGVVYAVNKGEKSAKGKNYLQYNKENQMKVSENGKRLL
jgi:hypothetical protein